MSWTSERRILALFRHHKEQPSGWRTAIPVVLNGHQAAASRAGNRCGSRAAAFGRSSRQMARSRTRLLSHTIRHNLGGHAKLVGRQGPCHPRSDPLLGSRRSRRRQARSPRVSSIWMWQQRASNWTMWCAASGYDAGLMEASVRTLMRWTADDLGLEESELCESSRTISGLCSLYERCGFRVVRGFHW